MLDSKISKTVYEITPGSIPLGAGYQISFTFFSNDQIKVYLTNGLTQTEVDSSKYSIVKSETIYKVVFISEYIFPSDAIRLVIAREVVFQQNTNLINGELIDAEVLERALDIIVSMGQQLKEITDRAVLSPISENAQTIIPEKSDRAGRLLGFDEHGEPKSILTSDIEQKLEQSLSAQEQVIALTSIVEQYKNQASQSASESAESASRADSLVKEAQLNLIDSIEQTISSTESGGLNEVTITQKDSKQSKFVFYNGGTGPQGPAVPLVQTTGQSTTEAMSQKAVSDSLDSLKSDLTYIVGAINIGSWVENEYVDNNDGGFKSDAIYKRTGYIECLSNAPIEFTNSDTEGLYNEYYNCWYDANKNRISGFKINKGGTVTLTSPENAKYFALSCNKSITETAQYDYSNSLLERMAECEGAVGDITDKTATIALSNNLVDFENMEWVDGVYIDNSNGAEVPYDTWKASPYIELDGSKEYAMLYENETGKLGTFGGRVFYAWYNASKTYLTGGNTGSVLTYRDNNAKYLRVSMGKSQSKNLVLNLSSVISGMVGESSSIIIPYGHIKINNEVNIKSLDARVTNLEKHPSYELPSTWASKLEALRIAKGTKFTFGIQTDTHYTMVNDDINFGNDIKTITKSVGVDFIANLGDIIRGYSTPDVDDTTHTRESYTEIMKRYVDGVCCPFLFSVGNHDKNTMWANSISDPSAIIGLDEIYSRTLALSNNTIKKFSSDGRSLYYYIDFDDAEIRAIVLNTTDASDNTNFYISQEQCDWFASKALDTNYSVIVLGHAPLEGTADYMVYNNVQNGTVIMSALRAFKSKGGEVIGCFWGHTHAQVSETVNGILHVAFTYRDTAEFVMINKSNKSISTIGFGGAVDRSFTWS